MERIFKWYYDKKRIFPIAALLKRKQAVYYIQISLFTPEMFQFLKYAN